SKTNDIKKIKIFAFDSEQENDISAAFHIKNILVQKININIEIIPYLGINIDYFLEEFISVDYMIVIRFHAAILCDYFKIPYLPFAYSNKMTEYIYDNNSHQKILNFDNLTSESTDISLSNFSFRTNVINKGHFLEFNKLVEATKD